MNIQKVIREHGFTIQQVAERMVNSKDGSIGVSQGSLSTILNGNPTLSKLQEIASIIGVPVSELVREEDEQRSTLITCPHCGKEIKSNVE